MNARAARRLDADVAAGDAVKQYADDVVAGKIIAGPSIRAAANRHLNDLKRSRRKAFPYKFDLAKAGKIINFYPAILTLRSGPTEGQPFELFDWQKFMLGSLMGWVRKDGGLRRFRAAYVQSGKGSGKTPVCAGLAIWMSACDGEKSPEIYIAARDFRQAGVLFKDLIAAIEESPVMSPLFKVYGGRAEPSRAYIQRDGFGTGEIHRLANDGAGRGVSGFRPSCVVADEIAEWDSAVILDLLRRGSKQREQPLFVAITNAGAGEDSVAYPYYQHAHSVVHGKVVDESFFAMVFDLDEDDVPFEDEACWVKANPSYPTLPTPDYLRAEVNRAKSVPTERNMVRRMHWNEWVNNVAEFFIAPEVIENAFVPKLNESKLKSVPMFVGMDLSIRLDLTAGVMVWREMKGDKETFYVRAHFWMPGDNLIQRSQIERIPYDVWAEEGYLTAVEGNTIDYSYPANWLLGVAGNWNLRGMAYDAWRADTLQTEMKTAGVEFALPDRDGYRPGVTGIPMWKHPQAYGKGAAKGKQKSDGTFDNGLLHALWMSESIEKMEVAMVEGRVKIEENPVMRNNLMSVKCDSDGGGNRRFTKRKSTGKIDGAVALAMAFGLALAVPVERKSVMPQVIVL